MPESGVTRLLPAVGVGASNAQADLDDRVQDRQAEVVDLVLDRAQVVVVEVARAAAAAVAGVDRDRY